MPEELSTLRALYRHAPIGILLSAPDGRIFAANPAACEILRLTEAEICERGRNGIADPSDADHWVAALLKRQHHQNVSAMLDMRRGDGTVFTADVSSSIFPLGDSWGACVFFRDATVQQRTEQYLRAVSEVTRELLGGTELLGELTAIAHHARLLARADLSWITHVSDGALDVVAGDGRGVEPLLGKRFEIGETLSGLALAEGRPMYVDLHSDRWELSETYQRLGQGPAFIVPLNGGGRRFGSLVVSRDAAAPPFAPTELPLIEVFASTAAVALSLAEARLEAERQAINALHRAALPTRLALAAPVEVAARYAASSAREQVGGDWYDAFERDDGTVVLMIGDVAGKGLSAASMAMQLRNAARAHLLDGDGPAAVLDKLHRSFSYLQEDAGSMATATMAILDPAASTLTYASAGHFPPAVRDERGVRWLDAVPTGLPLCAGFQHVAHREAAVLLAPTAAIVFVTDGVLEQRGESLDEGMDRLVQMLRSAPPRADALAEAALQANGRGGTDDRCVLVARLMD